MRKLHIFNKLISRLIRTVLGSLLLFASLLLFTNVILRYLFLSPIFWAEELARYLMVWLIFLGAGELAGGEGHISVNIVPNRLGKRAELVTYRLVQLLCLVFCASLTLYSWEHTMRIRSAHQLMAALELPMWWAYLAIPVGSALMTVRYGSQLVASREDEER
jgi:C4-dicarboxylate transporter DctQ subunit